MQGKWYKCHFIFDVMKRGYVECCPSVTGAIAPDHWVIPCPSPSTVAMFQNTNRNSSPFLRAAGIEGNSKEHKELKVCYISSHIPCDLDFHGVGRPPSKLSIVSTCSHSSTWKSKHQNVWINSLRKYVCMLWITCKLITSFAPGPNQPSVVGQVRGRLAGTHLPKEICGHKAASPHAY